MSKLVIPENVLNQHVVALGKTGAGKSSVLRYLVEDLLSRDKRVCIIDPKGDWWGLKLSASGKGPGFPVVIFGGEHADVPINPHAGAQIAELVATGNRPCIIDMGGFGVGERTRFFIDYAAALFKHNRSPLWQVIDEVHNFAPQQGATGGKRSIDGEAPKMLHWANRLASEGRGKAITLLAASQRPQKTHKDFITSMETLIAMRVIHPLDRNAIREWIDGAPDREKGREVLESLATMARGIGWTWSPEIGFGPERVPFPLFKTYDSFAAPTGESHARLSGWAAVDLDDVTAKLAKVVEEAKANDPAALKREVADLRRQLAAKPAPAPAEVKTIERPVVTDKQVKAVESIVGRLEKEGQRRIEAAEVLRASGQTLIDTGREFASALRAGQSPPPVTPRPSAPPARPALPQRAAAPVQRADADGSLGKCERSILAVLAQYPDGCFVGRLTLLAGYTYNGSFRTALSTLRMAGMISGGNQEVMRITPAGEAQGPFDPLPEGGALVDYWVNHPRFGLCERKILRALVDIPDGLTSDQLCNATGYTFNGSFRTALSTLRTAGVIVGKNTETMRASDELLEAAV